MFVNDCIDLSDFPPRYISPICNAYTTSRYQTKSICLSDLWYAFPIKNRERGKQEYYILLVPYFLYFYF